MLMPLIVIISILYNYLSCYGYTPLHFAAKKGNIGIVKLLITHNSKINEISCVVLVFSQFIRFIFLYTPDFVH